MVTTNPKDIYYDENDDAGNDDGTDCDEHEDEHEDEGIELQK